MKNKKRIAPLAANVSEVVLGYNNPGASGHFVIRNGPYVERVNGNNGVVISIVVFHKRRHR